MIASMLRGFYPFFLPFVLYGIFLRVREKKWSRGESILLGLFLLHGALVLMQIFWCRGYLSRRYLLTAAPLVFGWAGYALHKLVSFRIIRWFIPLGLLFLLMHALRPSLEHYWKASKKEEFFVIRKSAPVIRRDWQGKERFYAPEINWHYYRSPGRPVVQCKSFPLLGYAAGGSSMARCDTALPLPDYCVFENRPVEPPYIEMQAIAYKDKVYKIGKLKK